MVIKLKKKYKMLIVGLVIIILMFFICNQIYAIDPTEFKPKDPTQIESQDVLDIVGVILGTLRNASAVVAVIAIMIMGVKYILGSVEEKANYKETMFPYIIGCIMAVAGTTLVSFLYTIHME